MSEALELKKVARAKEVLEFIIAGYSITEACEQAQIPKRSFSRYVAEGVCDPLIAEMQRAMQVTVASLIAEAMPEVIQQRITDAKTATSPRDRDQAARSLGILWARFCEPVVGEPNTGEAQRWLAKHRDDFRIGLVAVQAQPGSVVNVGTGKENEDEVDNNEPEVS